MIWFVRLASGGLCPSQTAFAMRPASIGIIPCPEKRGIPPDHDLLFQNIFSGFPEYHLASSDNSETI